MEEQGRFEKSRKANELRKAGEFPGAQHLYEAIWTECKDKYAGAGLLHCLRKQSKLQEASAVADDLIGDCEDCDWARKEVIWTLLKGRLTTLAENGHLSEIIPQAEIIMSLRPEDLAAKLTVFSVLKAAKEAGKWDIVKEWTEKINPNSLSIDPIKLDNGRDGWSDQAQWYNFRINALIETENAESAVPMLEHLIQKFPGQRKFFLRLKALALRKMGQLPEAEVVYSNLCKRKQTDWWLLHEYAIVVRDLGRKEDALTLMCTAALNNPKLEMMVSMFVDMGELCLDLGKSTEAKDHFHLAKLVREENGWSMPQSLLIGLAKTATTTESKETTLREAFKRCRAFWNLTTDVDSQRMENCRPSIRRNLQGRLSLGHIDRQFCFIKTKTDGDVFCYKSELPGGIADGDLVQFDAVPSFDKKRNRQGLKGRNVRRVQEDR